MTAQGMDSFNESYQSLLLLVGEPEATELFNAQLQAILNRIQVDAEEAKGKLKR